MSIVTRKRLYSELERENGRQFKVRIRDKDLNEKSVLREANMMRIYEKTKALLFSGANCSDLKSSKKNVNSEDIQKSALHPTSSRDGAHQRTQG
ncbi:uncharacterized protein LOC111049810 isoform X2 [Nilaparvata lugens]|uniref:uncharacterized protein LOC111049810 isoform X2 n=1 Tax=Nilaparvata lugens TaxID=108931 RepID=UPI00193CED32|nr:uncharacterized protein LOC111049810 isoform X2 [Nilaparvata lugens]